MRQRCGGDPRLPVSKPAISKPLKVLEESGVVRVIHGRNHRLSPVRALDEAAEWSQRARWSRLFGVVDDYVKEESA